MAANILTRNLSLGRGPAVFLCLFALASSGIAEAHSLKYGKAGRAAQERANQFAGQGTAVSTLFKIGDHQYYAQAKWNRVNPTGCTGCGYDPNTGRIYDTPTTEYCFVELKVKFKSGRSKKVRSAVTGHACF